MRKSRTPYRQGVVITTSHPRLHKGQIIEILEEDEKNYKIRTFLTAKTDTIEKTQISLN